MKKFCAVMLALCFGGFVTLWAASTREDARKTADDVIMTYMRAVQTDIAKDPRALGQDGMLRKFDELGKKHLLANKKILHAKAVGDYMKIDAMLDSKLSKQRKLAWKNKSEYVDAKGDITVPEANDKVGNIVIMFVEGGYGIPPFGRHSFAARWWDPVVAARIIRQLSLKQLLSGNESQKRQFIEQFAPPRIHRLNKDPEKPSIAFSDGKEIFVVDMEYSADIGIYCLTGIRWVEMKDFARK